jgi:zinc transporter 2
MLITAAFGLFCNLVMAKILHSPAAMESNIFHQCSGHDHGHGGHDHGNGKKNVLDSDSKNPKKKKHMKHKISM